MILTRALPKCHRYYKRQINPSPILSKIVCLLHRVSNPHFLFFSMFSYTSVNILEVWNSRLLILEVWWISRATLPSFAKAWNLVDLSSEGQWADTTPSKRGGRRQTAEDSMLASPSVWSRLFSVHMFLGLWIVLCPLFPPFVPSATFGVNFAHYHFYYLDWAILNDGFSRSESVKYRPCD